MAANVKVDPKDVARHQAGFSSFMKATTYMIVGVVILVAAMRLFLV